MSHVKTEVNMDKKKKRILKPEPAGDTKKAKFHDGATSKVCGCVVYLNDPMLYQPTFARGK
jgi:hypothetical protein